MKPGGAGGSGGASGSGGRGNLRLVMVCAALTLVAAVPRFARLGALSFYDDEDITAMVASSVARGTGAHLPSGMEYRRALPFTWAAARSARWFGETREASYRLPSALLGTLTVPLLFLLGRWLIGERTAFVAALLLAFSQWHLLFSRLARMYAPFLLFYLAAAFALLVWARGGRIRYFAIALVVGAAAVTLHLIGMLLVVFALLPLVFAGWTRVPPSALVLFAIAIAAATQIYEQQFVAVTYAGWVIPEQVAGTAPRSFLETISALSVALAVAGSALGVWITLRTRLGGRMAEVALFGSAVAAGAFAGAGQLYGLGLAAAVFLLIHPLPRESLARQAAVPLALLLVVAIAGVCNALIEAGSLHAVRRLLEFPYPYAAVLALELPGVCLLFAAAVTWLALRAPGPEDEGLRIAALAVLLPLAALGLSGRDPASRFAIGVYPFLLLVAGAALLALTELPRRWIKRWSPSAALATAVLVVVSGFLGDHGLPRAIQAVWLDHGEPLRMRGTYPFRPDHAAPGKFVRRIRAPADVVIAEDVLQQRWYSGPIDYWFRQYDDARGSLYPGPDGRLRDNYVNSAIAADPLVIDSLLARTQGRVWFISSGETSDARNWFLTPRQARWLDSLEQNRRPVFIGRDRVTRVYCLNCGNRP